MTARSLQRVWLLALALVLLLPAAAHAQKFPQLAGRVVDNANLLDPAQEISLTQKLQALEQATSRQLVVATIPDLQGYPIEDYTNRLFRAWGLGYKDVNNGALLLVAPNERKVRIEVGYGLEPILTDALSTLIILNQMLPRFKQGDMAGGISAGTDAIIEQLQAPPEEAERKVLQAQQQQAQQQARRAKGGGDGGSIFPLLFWGFIFLFVILPMLRRGGRRGRRYRHSRGGFPIVIWGPGFGGGGGWGGGGFGGGGGGFGGFMGGGGSSGGGGASGSW